MVVLVTGYDGRALKVHGRGTGIVSFALDPVAFHNRISPEWPVFSSCIFKNRKPPAQARAAVLTRKSVPPWSGFKGI
jgi:hypothetical protein